MSAPLPPPSREDPTPPPKGEHHPSGLSPQERAAYFEAHPDPIERLEAALAGATTIAKLRDALGIFAAAEKSRRPAPPKPPDRPEPPTPPVRP